MTASFSSRTPPNKLRLLGLLSLILLVGFLATSIASYVVSRDTIRQGIAQQTLPLTGDSIYSEIQKDLLRPVFISSLMAHDTFVRDWILAGEQDPERLARYLREVQQKYGALSSFLVSERTHKYYYGDGVLKTVQPSVPVDRWFFRVRGMKDDYETNVDPDEANRNNLTIFINYRVLDYQGRFIAATGVGLTLDTVGKIIDSYEQRFHRKVFFVDRQGNIVMTGSSMRDVRGSIRNQPGLGEVANALLNRSVTPTSLEYRVGGAPVLVNSRFLPELGWYLVVSQAAQEEVRPVRQVFFVNLAISGVVTLLVLVIILLAVNRFQGRMERLAAIDMLTGFLNRQAFEIIYQQFMLDVDRSGRPLSAVLFDIDLFKSVNDRYGHLAGDRVIRAISQLTRGVVRESDVVVRWGGEEFLVLLKDCGLEKATDVAEKLRQAVADHRFEVDGTAIPVTISLGVAQYISQEAQASFFARTDRALYRAKELGRDRVERAGNGARVVSVDAS